MTKIIVRITNANSEDGFWKITLPNLIKLLALPVGDRFDCFYELAKPTKVHSGSEAQLYMDDSGNRTPEEFWEEVGLEWTAFAAGMDSCTGLQRRPGDGSAASISAK